MSKATMLAILGGLCWGIGELFTKSVLNSGRIGPVTVLAVRTMVALPFFWATYYYSAKSEASGRCGRRGV